MGTLILYASKYGATQQIATALAEAMGGAELQNLRDGAPDLAAYDTVLLGGPVYMGKLDRSVDKFAKKQEAVLLTKRLGLFLGASTPPDTAGYVDRFFSPALTGHAAAKAILGGLLQMDKLNPIYKKILAAVRKSEQAKGSFQEPQIERERIAAFAAQVQAAPAGVVK